MNWEALGAISEAAGAIAVFISFLYVAVQIRQNTRQIARSVEANQLAAFERNVESGNHIRELLILHPDLAQLLLSGFRSFRELKGQEKFRFGMLLRNIFAGIQGGYVRQLSLVHDPLEFAGTARLLDEILIHRGTREWLEVSEPDWRPEFRKLVDARLLEMTQQQAASRPAAAPLI